MHLKRYRRENVQEALRAVKEDLGPYALLLSTQEVRAAGVRGLMGHRDFEITAAAERPSVSAARHPEPMDSPAPKTNRAEAEIVARLEASGMDSRLAREIAAAHPAKTRRGATARALR